MQTVLANLFKNYWVLVFCVAIFSYFLGSLNFPIIVTNFFKINNKKQDIREVGSKNAGFTNVLRERGIFCSAITFAGDFLKGFLAVFLTKYIFENIPEFSSNNIYILCAMYLSAFFCSIGHIFPCFFNFKGGKGILTTWATILLLDWKIFLILIVIFLIIAFSTKIISLGSIVVAFLFPLLNFAEIYMKKLDIFNEFLSVLLLICLPFITSFIILFMHRANISRILNKTEKKLVIKK